MVIIIEKNVGGEGMFRIASRHRPFSHARWHHYRTNLGNEMEFVGGRLFPFRCFYFCSTQCDTVCVRVGFFAKAANVFV
jgi:hypothetical protein